MKHDSAELWRYKPALTRQYTIDRTSVERSSHTMTEARDSVIRVNESDLSALKAARDQIDSSLALGAVARLGAQQLMSEESDDSEVGF